MQHNPDTHFYGLKMLTHFYGLAAGPHGLSPLALLLMLTALVAAVGIVIRWRTALARR